jgi:hypothetical protein
MIKESELPEILQIFQLHMDESINAIQKTGN